MNPQAVDAVSEYIDKNDNLQLAKIDLCPITEEYFIEKLQKAVLNSKSIIDYEFMQGNYSKTNLLNLGEYEVLPQFISPNLQYCKIFVQYLNAKQCI